MNLIEQLAVVLARWKPAVVLEQGYRLAGHEQLGAVGPLVLALMKVPAGLAETTDGNE